MLGRQTPWKPSQPATKSQPSSSASPLLSEADLGAWPVEPVDAEALGFESDRAAGREPGRDQVLHDLVLAVDRDRLAAGQPGEVDPVAPAGEGDLEPLVDQALARHPRAEPELVQQVDGALLEHARPDPGLDVVPAVALEHDRIDALPLQQMRQQQARRARADDADLGVHDCGLSAPPSFRLGRQSPHSGIRRRIGSRFTAGQSSTGPSFDGPMRRWQPQGFRGKPRARGSRKPGECSARE